MKGKNENIIINYPGLISLACIKKIPEQMEYKICKVTAGKNKGTGFFTKIPFPDKNNMLPVFITNNHIINEAFLNKKDAKIQIDIKAENQIKEIYLNNRMNYTSDEKQYDITIIEIKEEDNIKHFLELDDIIINGLIANENRIKEFIDETIYILQYPKHKLAISFGILKDIDLKQDYNFSHKCSTEEGSSGAPILNMNNKVIGIHSTGINKIGYNLGTFLTEPIKYFTKTNITKIKKSKKVREPKKCENLMLKTNNSKKNNENIKILLQNNIIEGKTRQINRLKALYPKSVRTPNHSITKKDFYSDINNESKEILNITSTKYIVYFVYYKVYLII